MLQQEYTSFDTRIGVLAIAWTVKGISAVQLPEANPADTLEVLKSRLSKSAIEAAAPSFVREAIALIKLHLEGKTQEFTRLRLDFSGVGDFAKKVYIESIKIPSGSVITYGELAARVGSPQAARAVGRALGSNPIPIIVPCHRIIGKNGNMTGFSSFGGCDTKMRLLSIEHALASDRVAREVLAGRS